MQKVTKGNFNHLGLTDKAKAGIQAFVKNMKKNPEAEHPPQWMEV